QPRPGAAPAAGGRSDALVQHVDVLPTLAECLGVEPPPAVQGQSFLAALSGGPAARQAAYFDTPRGWQRGILRDGWKLVEMPASGTRRLYRLDGASGDREDVASAHPERVAALADELERHRHEN